MRLDLHMHTTASDGAFAPSEVVRSALEGGLDVISITDHDTTSGIAPALQEAKGSGLRVLTGTELSSTHGGQELHILGYGIDPAAEGISAHRARARDLRIGRMHEMIERLASLGVHLDYEQVERHSGPGGEMVGRPHLAQALVEIGAVPSFRAAFDRYIANGGPAYVPTELQTPAEAIETIAEAGGLAVWAHPPASVLHDVLPGLVDEGLAGLEVYRPLNSDAWIWELEESAKHFDLVTTGGSDWHNLERNPPLGAWHLESDQIPQFVEMMGLPAS